MIKEKSIKQGTIFIVEDELLLMEVTKINLSKHFNNIETYSNGRNAFEAIKEKKPDVVILDVKLPGMGGFDILKKIKSSNQLSSVKVIMVTGMTSDQDVEKGHRLGADGYMNKPFKNHELVNRIQELLKEPESDVKNPGIPKKEKNGAQKREPAEVMNNNQTERYIATQLSCQIVWVTKYRDTGLKGDVQRRCRELINQVCRVLEVRILDGIIKEDCVRMQITYPSHHSLRYIISQLKSRTSELLQEEFPELHKMYWGQLIWASGYGAYSAGNNTDDRIDAYLEYHRSDKSENNSDLVLK